MEGDFDLSDMTMASLVDEIRAQVIEMKARLRTMQDKKRPREMQRTLSVRIAIMQRGIEMLESSGSSSKQSDPESKIEEDVSDDWED